MEKVRGIYTALCTPVMDGKVNAAAMDKLVNFVIDNGTTGLVALGGTGEYCALTNEQRIDGVKMTIAANKGRVPVVAGIIGPGLPEAIEMGNKCKELGADAIMVVTPYYVVANQQGIYDYYRQVMKNVDLPLVLYNIPYRTGVNMLPETVERLLDSDDRGQIVAMKECCPNMGQVLELLSKVRERTSVLTGEEFLFYQEISCGAQGGILATSNLLPKMWADIFDLIVAGKRERAAEIVVKVTPLLRLIFAESNPGPLKDAMKMIGIDCGDPLLPLEKPGKEIVDGLARELKKFQDWYK
ncbi:4-hydroxy-tetrahydrodipicolinate synthase [Cloacibacillus evryensis]|uniref:4-hydroxy-tetrahydrodipicolinate synthase n=1 Tax=Cloacibacillus evryensis TaxID=508460 RepID=A0AAW5K5E5_9BACT|nr:4-hydroxy-tetrahydrodipicolinate synthase [Cloacibacillus evryensis]EHL71368.1 dihydrodipicolinate synthase [Synergistes sp. 3_1_syn1]MCQ4764340.1 4-hydroxy-tetrahydrodipicolinate synthase [Cloacibacillus evryensis]MCQ4813723.1 4-hydroxy-tetrahydrodipicolinate synthase [Cloacibacillus evryensis]